MIKNEPLDEPKPIEFRGSALDGSLRRKIFGYRIRAALLSKEDAENQ